MYRTTNKAEDFSLRPSNMKAAMPVTLVNENTIHDYARKESASVSQWIKGNGFTGKAGQILPVPDKDGRIKTYLAGMPAEKDLYALTALSAKLPAGDYRIINMDKYFGKKQAYQAVLGWALDTYRFGRFKQQKAEARPHLVIPSQIDGQKLLSEAAAVYMVRDLINRPANDLGTKELTDAARTLAGEFNSVAKVITGTALLDQDYPLIHTVGRASVQEPALADFTWGDENHPKVTIVGKGIVFDSGGLDLKPAASMYGMEKDMGGAAHALGLARMIMEANLPIRLRVMIPAAENAVGPDAYRPGDILTSRKDGNGRSSTIEVGNTDAEGRLVLTDALIEASKENPDILIDYATLTGAQRIAHGMEIGGAIGTDRKMLRKLEDTGEKIDDYVAMLPLHMRYKQELSSKKADIKSTGGKAGSITAALFLHHFVQAAQWVHFDISGNNPVSSPAKPEGGEATGMRTMFRYLEKRFRP